MNGILVSHIIWQFCFDKGSVILIRAGAFFLGCRNRRFCCRQVLAVFGDLVEIVGESTESDVDGEPRCICG